MEKPSNAMAGCPGLVAQTGSSARGDVHEVVKLTFAWGARIPTHRGSSIPAWKAAREGRSTSTKGEGRRRRVQGARAGRGGPDGTLAMKR